MPEQGMLKRPELVLASSSPRRRELLARVGVEAAVRPADIDETPHPGESPRDMVQRLAIGKATAAATAETAAGNDVVLGADTTIDLDGVSLGKPADHAEAKAMLQALSGRQHLVLTGVAVVIGARRPEPLVHADVSTSTVSFRHLTDDEIDWYVASGEPQGKAGAYALQGAGDVFVTEIVGSYSGIVGLPLSLTDALLGRIGRPLRSWARPAGDAP